MTRFWRMLGASPSGLTLEYVIGTEDMYTLEQELQTRFWEQRNHYEWFRLDPEDVEYIKGLAR